MRVIGLSKGFQAEVDDEDYEKVSNRKWYALVTKRAVYACNKETGRPAVLMHRVIMDAPRGMLVDHRDRNGLNNCRSNLRLCTQSENHRNKMTFKGSSKYKGVFLRKRDGTWCAQIAIDRHITHLGTFKTESEAAIAYNVAAVKMHGEFARLNAI
jgi:hypothetical protein